MNSENLELPITIKKSIKNALLCSLIIIGFTAKSQSPGYYITAHGDTVKGSIKQGLTLMGMQNKIKFIDGSNKKIKLQPGPDILEVGFTDENETIKMRSFKIGDFDKTALLSSGNYKFVLVLFEGKINAYRYYKTDMNGNPDPNTYVNKVKTKEWGLVALIGHKKIAKKFFADCDAAMKNFEGNDGFSDFLNCVQYYNQSCN